MLKTRSVYTSEGTISRVACAISKPNDSEDTDIVYVAFIEDGTGFLGKTPSNPLAPIEKIKTFGLVSDIAIAIDCSWTKKEGQHTFGDPWIAYINQLDEFYVEQSGAEPTLLSTGVSCCSICRGWKHEDDISSDQGIVTAYVKNSKVYTRSFYTDNEGNQGWSTEEEVPELSIANINFINTFRTIDYRIGITVGNGITTKVVLSKSSWSGLAIQDEYFTSSVGATSGTLTPISSKVVNYLKSDIFTSQTGELNGYLGCTKDLSYVLGKNINSTQIELLFDTDLSKNPIDVIRRNIKISDELGNPILIKSISKIEGFNIIVNCHNFNYIGNKTITAKIENDGTLKNSAGIVVSNATGNIILTGLTGEESSGPKVVNIENVGNDIIRIDFDSDITSGIDTAKLGIEILGKEYEAIPYPTDKLTVKYRPSSIELIAEKRSLKLRFALENCFRNAIDGEILVKYSSSNGLLAGDLGIVSSFDKTFNATGLTPLNNIGAKETILTGIDNISGKLTPIIQLETVVKEAESMITSTGTAKGTLNLVGEIRP